MSYDIRNVKNITDLISYFSQNLGWDISIDDFDDIEDISYDFDAEDIGLKEESFAKISSLRQLQPLVDGQKWGIFCVEFDSNKFEVSALRKILSGLIPRRRNSADHAVWCQQDLLFICNWGNDNRANGSGCPYCAKGAQTSFPEQAIYYYVKKAYPDTINKYKDLFTKKGMELDVFIPSIKTGIEYDGIAFHRSERQLGNDRTKSTICNANGIRLIRIKEDPSVGVFPTDIIISADNGLENAFVQLASIVPNLGDIDLKRDEDDIRKGYLSLLENNSLLAINPDLCKEWNYEKNKTTPDMYSPNSNTRVWWKCMLGHEWKTSIDERNRGRKCPYCSNRLVLSGFNDLATKRPDLMSEWNSEKNKDLDPTKILPGSGKKAWWICKNGHEWQAEISSRNKGAGCPICGNDKKGHSRIQNRISISGSLLDNNPQLAGEWHPTKNGTLAPCDVTKGSNKKVWWKCGKCGFEWEAEINSRNRGRGCPECYRQKRSKSTNN